MSFKERLGAMKSKQEAAEQTKKEKEEAEKAALAEKEKRRGELSAERERVAAELIAAEAEAKEAEESLAEAETFAAKEGENLDPEAKAEFDALKQEASAVKQKFEGLKAESARIDAELSGKVEAGTAETKVEAAEKTPELTPEEAEKILNDEKWREKRPFEFSDKDRNELLSAYTKSLRRRIGSNRIVKDVLFSSEETADKAMDAFMENGVVDKDYITELKERKLSEKRYVKYTEREMEEFVSSDLLDSLYEGMSFSDKISDHYLYKNQEKYADKNKEMLGRLNESAIEYIKGLKDEDAGEFLKPGFARALDLFKNRTRKAGVDTRLIDDEFFKKTGKAISTVAREK